MKFKKSSLFIFLIICLFFMASVNASDLNDTAITATEDNLEIDQPTDDVMGVEESIELASSGTDEVLKADEQTFSQLNTTINNTDKDIYLESDYKYSDGDDSFKGGIVIDRDLNIYGNGHTIDGSGEARIFKVIGGNVVFYNITFVNGHVDGWSEGGAINGGCKAINCTFKENQAYSGGAMSGGSAVNCIFTSNKASSTGGAMYYGSAVNCIFTSNSATSGGVMYGSSAVNCTFTANKASSAAGAMYDCSAVNCTFTGNQAYHTGAMYASSAVNCTFTGNSATIGGVMYGGYAVNCIGQEEDYAETGDLVLHFDANDFTTVSGSGETLPIKLRDQDKLMPFINYDVVIYRDGEKVRTYHCLSNDDLSLDLLPGIYTAELAVTYPGLDKPEPKNIQVTIIGKSFSELNKTINNNSNDVIYLDADYTYNSTADSALSEGIVINRDVVIYGNGHTINGNKEARIFKVTGGNVVFYNISFVNGDASNGWLDDGGAVNGDCKAINCTFKENHAKWNGGAMYGGSAVDCTFINNSAENGGAMYGGSAVNCSFSGNHANNIGGAMRGGSAVDCIFTGNFANRGGAMFGGSAVDCIFTGNSANNFGGAMFGGSAVDCIFTGNSAGDGGAMFGGSAVDCTFINNSAENGGAMSDVSAVNCSFSGNSAYSGGAMFGGYKVNCIGQDSDFYYTKELALHWVADNFTTVYGSGETLPIKLKNQYDDLIDFINYDVVIYNDSGKVKTYHCLSNDDLSFDLPIGIYTAELAVTYPGLSNTETKSITLTVTTDGTTFWDLNQTINGNTNGTINLDKNYTFNPAIDSAFSEGIEINRDVIIYGNGHTINGSGKVRIFNITGGNVEFHNITFVNGNASNIEYVDCGGAVYGDCKAINCTFKENHASLHGGAMYLGSAVDCIFTGNSAEDGGAMFGGSAIDCNFTNNSANCGGAMYLGYAVNCTFYGNHADSEGGAMMGNSAVDCIFTGNSANLSGGAIEACTAVNCTFTDNSADGGGAMYHCTAILCIFENNGYNNTVIVPAYLNASNFTSVWESGEKLLFNLTADNVNYYGFNTTITVFKDGQPVGTYYALSGDGWVVNLTAGTYKVVLSLDKYEGVVNGEVTLTINKTNSTLTINDNVTFDYKTNGSTTVSFTNASTVVAEVIGQPNAIVVVNGTTITVSGLDAGNYTLSVTTVTDENHNNVTKTATITVNKLKTQLTASAVTTTYQVNKNLVITLKDSTGKALSGVKVTVNLNGAKTYTTDKNGQVKINVAKLVPKTYTAKVTFAGNTNYVKSSADVKVTVKKAKPKIIAKKKTYKAAKKNKKFKITLKDNKGKAIKKVKVRLIVQKIKKTSKKKTSKKSKKVKKKNIVKTNKKGKATFKVNRYKKAKYLATVKFYGNKYYAKAVKKVKIKMK